MVLLQPNEDDKNIRDLDSLKSPLHDGYQV
jgi:hypothetical protein